MDNHNDNNLDTDLNPEDEKEGLKRLGSSLESARKKRSAIKRYSFYFLTKLENFDRVESYEFFCQKREYAQ